MILRETIVDIFKPSTNDNIKVRAIHETELDPKHTIFFIETNNDLISLPMETMVDFCAKLGNYLGFPKMEITPLVASSQINGVISTQNTEPSSPSPLGSVKTVEIE